MSTYPYIPNALPNIQQKMLDEIGISSIEELCDPSLSIFI